MKYKPIEWNWEPLISLGTIYFGEDMNSVVNRLGLELDESSENDDWLKYESTNLGIQVFSEDSKVKRISCFDNLIYKGRNLLGLSLEEVREIVGNETDIDEPLSYDPSGNLYITPVYFDELSMIIYLENGLVDSISVGMAYDD
jgi:hypothetical protein